MGFSPGGSMEQEVKQHWTLKDVLNAWAGERGKTLAAAVDLMSEEHRIELVNSILDTYCRELNDEQTPLILEALDRVVGKNDSLSMSIRMERLYWNLHPNMRRTRLWVIRKLLEEWNCDIGDAASLHAFRRFIAMVFPEPTIKQRREGESDVEMKARGESIIRADQQAALVMASERLASANFLRDDFLRSHADDIYAPWISQPLVPYELLSLIAMARAQLGGRAVVERDLRNAKILDGLPDTGITVIGSITSRMRAIAFQAETVLEDIVRRTQERNPGYDAHTNMKRHYEFAEIDSIVVEIRAHGGHDQADLFADSVMAVSDARKQGRLNFCNTRLTVYISPRDDKTYSSLTQKWSKGS